MLRSSLWARVDIPTTRGRPAGRGAVSRGREPRRDSGRRRWSGRCRRRRTHGACRGRCWSGPGTRSRRAKAGSIREGLAWLRNNSLRCSMQRFASIDHRCCGPSGGLTCWNLSMTICTVVDAHEVPETRRDHLGGEPADGRRGPVRPLPGLVRGLCDPRVQPRSRPPPRVDGPPQRAPWGSFRGSK